MRRDSLRLRQLIGMKRHTALIIAAILLLIPVLYLGSYLALVVPGGFRLPGTLIQQHGAFVSSRTAVAYYRIPDEWVERFFWPLEQIDRKVRPRNWMPVWKFPAVSDGQVKTGRPHPL